MAEKKDDSPGVKFEPVAIVGIGCRFPGGISSPGTFWEFLVKGGDGICEVPGDRWDINSYYHPDKDRKGKVVTGKGGFLKGVGEFDPRFFGISPREASFMDPQQRLLLEVAWESLEDGGVPPDSLAGSRTGVYVGLFMHDYENMHNRASEYNNFGPHSATGVSSTIAANRLSYIFDFLGPSLVIDTACSSSLVGIHLACQSLVQKETDLALAGGVNLILRPEMSMALSQAGMLSPDGYCKSFDHGANGYARAEGVAMIVLKRLADALRDHDPVYALIRGSAVNQDGRGNGLTVPNGEAQKRVLREAITAAGIAPGQIGYVEAHGTGTPVGDPIEAKALGEVLAADRAEDDFCLLGSVKSNFGHTESTAGVTGVIKTALMLYHKKIPPNLHFSQPNPAIPFDRLRLRVPTSLEDWPGNKKIPRTAGVNSFGFGGTNGHVIMQEYRESRAQNHVAADPAGVSGRPHPRLVPLSAKNEKALADYVDTLLSYVEEQQDAAPLSLGDLAYTTALRRSHHPLRLTVTAESMESFLEQLRIYARGEKSLAVATGDSAGIAARKTAFVFSGMGQQWWAMGRDLLDDEPLFREKIEQCDGLFAGHTDQWSLLKILRAEEAESLINQTHIAQPAIFSLQVALAALWESWGVVPDMIVGHSVGEIGAAHVAGALSLEDAVRVCYHRSRLQALTEGKGKMLAVGLGREEAESLCAGQQGRITVAAENSPAAVTLAGETKALEEVAARLENEKIFARFLKVEVPYHSPVMDSILDELESALHGLSAAKTHTPLVSTVTGGLLDGEELGASYWPRNVRMPVSFARAMYALLDNNCSTFLEIGAHPVLATSIVQCAAHKGQKILALPSLRRMENDGLLLRNSLGRLYCSGYPVKWEGINKKTGKCISLPAYQWQREFYWNESEESRMARMGQRPPGGAGLVGGMVHPLLGGRLDSAVATWNGNIDLHELSFLRDHKVQSTIVFPGAGYVELGLALARELQGDGSCVVEGLAISSPLLLSEEAPVALQVVQSEENSFSVFSKSDNQSEWNILASGAIALQDGNNSAEKSVRQEIRDRCPREMSRSEAYQGFARLGLEYGPCFQGLQTVWIGENEALGWISINDEVAGELKAYLLHPAILDACFQITAALPGRGTFLPVGVERLAWHKAVGRSAWGHVVVTERTHRMVRADIRILDEDGSLLVDLTGLTCQRVEDLSASWQSLEKILYTYEWCEKPGEWCEEPGGRDNSFFPTPARIRELLAPEIERDNDLYRRHRDYQLVEPRLDELCRAYILGAFRKLGRPFDGQEECDTGQLAQRMGIAAEHRLLFARLLTILKQDKALSGPVKGGGGWQPDSPAAERPASELWNEILQGYPSFLAELRLLDRCGSNMAEILTGELDPLSVIFPRDTSAPEHLYQDSPTFRIYNRIVQRAVMEIVGSLPKGKSLRILEIGAGTGALTSFVLPCLPAIGIEYAFTDISLAFTSKAERKFKEYPFVTYGVFNLEEDPLQQGYGVGSFDLILASDVLHATSDLAVTLGNVKKLLAPGGMLIAIEATKKIRWFDLVFGTLPGWWLFTDRDLRPDHALLSREQWLGLLEKQGFDRAVLADRTDSPWHSVLLARNPAPFDQAEDVLHNDLLPQETEQRPAVIFADSSGVADELSRLLEQKGRRVFRLGKELPAGETGGGMYHVDSESLQGLDGILDEIAPQEPRRSVAPDFIWLWGCDGTPAAMSSPWLKTQTRENAAGALAVIQAVADRKWQGSPGIWLVTRGGQPVRSARLNEEMSGCGLAQSPLWGMGRVAITEYPDVAFRMVDLSSEIQPEEVFSLCEEIVGRNNEDEIALRKDRRYVHRLAPVKRRILDTHNENGYRMGNISGGDGLSFSAFEEERKPPGAGEVEIRVHATGLNFKDVARLTGVIDGERDGRGHISGLGLEAAGRVTAIGDKVEGLAIGDEVMGLVHDGLGGYAMTRPRFLCRKPEELDFQGAATIPVCFSAAYHGLHTLARIKEGEKVLIHTATGGLGLAAIQVARAAGAEVFATAGSEEKRDFLRAMGVVYVGHSRDLSFVDEIREHIRGDGLDIVFNTLPGKAISGSIGLLKPVSGRFVELSNMHGDDSVALQCFKQGLSFFSFDLAKVAENRPQWIAESLRAFRNGFDRGIYNGLPYRAFSSSDLSEAFRLLKKGAHIGKVVIDFTHSGKTPVPSLDTIEVSGDATYLITGGLGGLGLATARWLHSCGARHLALVGRSGAADESARRGVEELRAAGVTVLCEKVDVTDEAQVAGLLETIEQEMAPLKGIVHSVMVLEDVPLAEMTVEELFRVMDPKVVGAWNLHLHTVEKELDFFLMYSSFSGMVGMTSQGNYAAANTFLDALAHYRRQQGLPGTSYCWGAVAEVGFVAQQEAVRNTFRRQGVFELLPETVFQAIRCGLQEEHTSLGVMPVDWNIFARYSHAINKSPRYSYVQSKEVTPPGLGGDEANQHGSVLPDSPEEREKTLIEILARNIGSLLGVSRETLDIELPLEQMGFDSLMAMELSVDLEKTFGMSVAKMNLLRSGLTVQGLAELVEKELGREKAPPSGAETGLTKGPDEELVVDVDAMSDRDIEEMLKLLQDNEEVQANGTGE